MRNLSFLNNYSGKLGAADPYAGSTAQYLNELTQITQRLADIELQIANPYLEASTIQDLQNEKIRLMARKSAINNWLTLSREQKNKVNAATYVTNLTNTFMAPLKKIQQQYQGTGFEDLLNYQVAGLPLPLVIGLVGAAVWLIYSNTKR